MIFLRCDLPNSQNPQDSLPRSRIRHFRGILPSELLNWSLGSSERPIIDVAVCEVVAGRRRDGVDAERLARVESGESAGHRGIRVSTLVDDTRGGDDGDDTGLLIEGRVIRDGQSGPGRNAVDDERRLVLRQGTAQAGLRQELLLVVVDVEVLEVSDLTLASCTEGVVDRVDHDADDRRIVFHDLDRNDLTYPKFGGDVGNRLEHALIRVRIAGGQEASDPVLRGVEVRRTRALHLGAVHDHRIDDLVHGRAGILDVDVDLRGVELVIGCDRTDLVLVDLVRIVNSTTIAEERRTGDFLTQHEVHLRLDPGDQVEVLDINDVVTVELLLLVDGLRERLTSRDLEELFLLEAALDITPSSSLLERQIRCAGLDSTGRPLRRCAEEWFHPLHPTGDPRRGTAVDIGRLGKEDLDVGDAVLKQ